MPHCRPRTRAALAVPFLLIASVGALSVRQSPGRTIVPYVQNVSPTGVTVMWESPTAARGSVAIAPARGGSRRSVQETSEATIHRVRVEGLRADTRYRYTVEIGGAAHSAEFRTAPTADRPVRFAVIGDSRFWKQLWEGSRLPEHLEHQAPEFSLHMGDLVDTGTDYALWPQHFTRFQRHVAGTPMFVARGNHEGNGRDPAVNWFSKYHELPGGEPYSSFDWGPAHFTIVSILAMGQSDMPRTLKFIEEDLAATRKPWRFVAFHEPVYCVGYLQAEGTRRIAGNKPLEDLFDRYNVDMVLNGHTHIYERSFPYRSGRRDDQHGTVYLVQGGSVGGHHPDRWTAALNTDIDMPHYSMVHLDGKRMLLESFALAKGTAERGVDAPIVLHDRMIRWRSEALPKRALAGLRARSSAARLAAIDDLGAMAYAPAAPAIERLLADPDMAIRPAAALALARIADERIAPALIRGLRDPDIAVRRHLARAIECAAPASLGSAISEHAFDVQQDPEVRARMLGALSIHAPHLALGVALRCMAPGELLVRQRAVDIVKRLATSEHATRMADWLENEPDDLIAGSLAVGLNRVTGKSIPVKTVTATKPGQRGALRERWLGQ